MMSCGGINYKNLINPKLRWTVEFSDQPIPADSELWLEKIKHFSLEFTIFESALKTCPGIDCCQELYEVLTNFQWQRQHNE